MKNTIMASKTDIRNVRTLLLKRGEATARDIALLMGKRTSDIDRILRGNSDLFMMTSKRINRKPTWIAKRRRTVIVDNRVIVKSKDRSHRVKRLHKVAYIIDERMLIDSNNVSDVEDWIIHIYTDDPDTNLLNVAISAGYYAKHCSHIFINLMDNRVDKLISLLSAQYPDCKFITE